MTVEGTIVVTPEQYAAARATIQSCINAGRDGTDVDVTAGGALWNLLNLDLGLRVVAE
jgi:hypothetical protein